MLGYLWPHSREVHQETRDEPRKQRHIGTPPFPKERKRKREKSRTPDYRTMLADRMARIPHPSATSTGRNTTHGEPLGPTGTTPLDTPGRPYQADRHHQDPPKPPTRSPHPHPQTHRQTSLSIFFPRRNRGRPDRERSNRDRPGTPCSPPAPQL
ncbi:unnamed protein product [Boreogadus saida]